jgi:hypothetical protein
MSSEQNAIRVIRERIRTLRRERDDAIQVVRDTELRLGELAAVLQAVEQAFESAPLQGRRKRLAEGSGNEEKLLGVGKDIPQSGLAGPRPGPRSFFP